MIRREPMSNLPGKITDTYFSREEQHTYSRFFKLLLRFLLLAFGCAAIIRIIGILSLFF
nr:MAG TPA: cytochrome c oxidase subunit IV [Caudoviricetes sp.]